MKDIDVADLSNGINRFKNARILVIGDIMLDHFIWGKVSRISPEAPVPVVGVERETTMLGGAANVVYNIVSAGGKALLCGCVGDDAPGREVVLKLKELGVDVGGVVVEHERPTTVKTRIIAHAQQVVRFDRESNNPLRPETTARVLEFVNEKKEYLSGVIVSDYGKGVISRQLMEGLRTAISGSHFPVTVDPSVKNFSLYQDVTIITPNHNQASEIAGLELRDQEDIQEIARVLMGNGSCPSLLITRGADGMSLFEEEGRVTHINAMARKVYDVTGAGDTVIAILTLGMTSGLDLRSAAYLSNLAAGLVVGEVGTSTVKVDDLRKLVDAHVSAEN
jgi:D-beta-D-heptose 7-phosphate kinase/D-beta-D-heptose 1-phosphate adenosyltransferase